MAPYWLSATTVTRLPLIILGYMNKSSGLIIKTHRSTHVQHFNLFSLVGFRLEVVSFYNLVMRTPGLSLSLSPFLPV